MNYKTTLKTTVVILLLLLSTATVSAQIAQKIGDNSYTINSNAVFELESTTKGFLPPRLSVSQQTALGATLPQGLLIYVIDGANEGIQLWDGTKWIYYVDAAELLLKASVSSPTFTGTVGGITATMVGLGNVNNTTDLLKPISTATQNALDLKANLASPTFTGTVGGITATMVGLGNVNNTTDLLKPISTATQNTLNTKEDLTNKITDINSDPTSDTKYPSVSAVKNYVDSLSNTNAITTTTKDYDVTLVDYTILCNTESERFELKLLDPREVKGKIYVIRKIDESVNPLSINPPLKLTETTFISSLNYPKTIRIQSNGEYWYVID